MKKIEDFDEGDGFKQPYVDGLDTVLEMMDREEAFISDEDQLKIEEYYNNKKKFSLRPDIIDIAQDWLDTNYNFLYDGVFNE